MAPEEGLALMRTYSNAELMEASDFNWLGLAQCAADRARTMPSKSWACVAIEACRILVDMSPPEHQQNHERRAMFVRAGLINAQGADRGDPVTNPDVVFDWFLGRLDVSFDEAKAFASLWTNVALRSDLMATQLAQIRHLWQIKNNLLPVECLKGYWTAEKEYELSRWLDLRSSLP